MDSTHSSKEQVPFHKVPPNCEITLRITTRFKKIAEFKGYWVGIDKKNYIICRLDGASSSSGMNIISEGCEVNARLYWDGKLIAFSSEIASLINEPARWMILHYPQHAISSPLRKSHRYECHQTATLRLDSQHVLKGVIKDISLQGCKFVPSIANKFDIDLLKGKDLQLETRFPASQSSNFLTCQVKNMPNDRGELAIGCKFIRDYKVIYQQISHQLVDK